MAAYLDPQSHKHLSEDQVTRVEKDLLQEFPVSRTSRSRSTARITVSTQFSSAQDQSTQAISTQIASNRALIKKNPIDAFLSKYQIELPILQNGGPQTKNIRVFQQQNKKKFEITKQTYIKE